MSDEPKTLTPEPATLQGLIVTLGVHGYSLAFQEGRWWAVPPQDAPYEWSDGDTPWEAASDALGVPVVARDEAAELRAAIKEWAEAKQAVDDADLAWANAIDAGADVHGYKAAWERALNRERDAEAVLRRLAGGESER